MGQFTPNIGLYIPSAGETNYNDAFAQGMVNLDQHDHTGGPNKGLPITSSGLSNFSVTYDKLNSNVADITTGIGTDSSPGNMNRLQILGILRNLFTLSTSGSNVGFVSMNGSPVAARTFQDTASVTWTNPDGVAGDPSASVNTASIFPVTVPDGGTGITSTTPWAILIGGTTSTANLQQVSGLGTINQYLASQGAGTPPIWQDLPTQNYQIATITLTQAQFTNLATTWITLIPAPGAGKVIVVNSIWGKLNYVAPFTGGSSVRLYFGSTSNEVGFVFNNSAFKDFSTGYYYGANEQTKNALGILFPVMENKPVTISVNSSDYANGVGSTVSFSCQYSIMQI